MRDSNNPIPLLEREGPLTMGLLWITMVVFFPNLLIGFEWHKRGLSFKQVILGCFLSALILLIYKVPATQLGAQTGLGYITLSKGVFGRLGAALVTINLICIFTLFYGLTALFEGEALISLFGWNCSLPLLSAVLAIIMAFNNLFGFKGIANFARYIAAPLLVIWVGYTFFKTIGNVSPIILNAPAKEPFSFALTTISCFIIGNSVWGNEKDYWRFSKPKVLNALIPLAVALFFGSIIFPTTGWLVSNLTGITDYKAATAFMNNYSFGGLAWIGAIVLSASYFAANDSNMFANIQACETIKNLPHKVWVLILAILGVIVALITSMSGTAKSLEVIASLNCISMPTPTVIMLAEWFLLNKLFKTKILSITDGGENYKLPAIRWPAIIALLCGITVGFITSGVIPSWQVYHIGISPVQAWLTAAITYIPLRIIEHNQMVANHTDMLERVLAKRFEQAQARLPIDALFAS